MKYSEMDPEEELARRTNDAAHLTRFVADCDLLPLDSCARLFDSRFPTRPDMKEKVLSAVKKLREDAKKGIDNPVLLPGWKQGKLVLEAVPHGKRPAVFAFGELKYTVPWGKAWDTVCDMIRAGAFDGHGLRIPSPNARFTRNHRTFFSERMSKNASGWFIKTL